MSLVKINRSDIAVGVPLAWTAYDADNNLLLRRGAVLETERQIESVLERGLYRDSALHVAARMAGSRMDTPSQTGDDEEAAEASFKFEDAMLQVGETLQMQSMAGQADVRCYVKLIGYMKGGSVLVSTPVVDGKIQLIRDGQNFVVRVFSGRNVYAFSTQVVKVTSVPYPHLHLAYPGAVRGLVVRRSARVDVSVIAAVGRGDKGSPGSHVATIANLSTGGALLVARNRFGEKGEKLAVKFRLNLGEVESYLSVGATIRSVCEKPANDGTPALIHHYGVEFDDIEAKDKLILKTYIYHKLIEHQAQV